MLGRHAQLSGSGGVPSRPKDSRPSTPAASTEEDHHRRSFSNEGNNPRPALTQNRQDSSNSTLLTTVDSLLPPTSKRLQGFFADKLSGTGSSSQSQTHHAQSASTSGNRTSPAPTLLPPRSHSRADSAPREPAIMAASSSSLNVSKVHTSPSKSTTGRTYDARLVSREMHRLGNLSHLPATHIPTSLSATPTAATLTLPTTASSALLVSSSSSERDNPWGALHVHVLPLFNGEPLRVPIEDLNSLVRRHISSVVSASPSKALSTLESDASELIASGMITLNSKLTNIEENKLLARVVDMWGFFWDQVLPYVEGALLPLQTDSLLSSLYRNPKTHRPSSPTRQASAAKLSISSMNISALGSSSHPHIDVRTVGLRGFRDQIIFPLYPRLKARLSMPNRVLGNEGYLEPRCNQMMLVLAFQTRQPSPPPSLSLTSPNPSPQVGPGEKALADLISALRLPHSNPTGIGSSSHKQDQIARAPSFLSGGLPRDRRGRIAQKRDLGMRGAGGIAYHGEEGGWDDGETPRNTVVGGTGLDMEREREREFLEGLRSPDPISLAGAGVGARASVGGWGLGGGVGVDESGKATIEEDEYTEEEDEPLTWDEAQLMVENIMIHSDSTKRRQDDFGGVLLDVPKRYMENYEIKGRKKDIAVALAEQQKAAVAAEKQIKNSDSSTPKPGRRMT